MSTPRKSSAWLPSFSFPGRSSHVPQLSDSSNLSTSALPDPSVLLSDSTEKDDVWDDEDHGADEERKKFPVLSSHPLFDRGALDESPPSSPSISDTASDDDDFESLMQHPHPISPATLISAPLHIEVEEYKSSVDLEEAGALSPDSLADSELPPSPTPSLVPTVIASRSPSPQPHPCVAEAEALMIKVRDFAYEEHGVPLARPVPDIETLKARYQLYRSADLTPPPEVIETLRDYDVVWFTEKKQFFDDRERESESKYSNNMWIRPRGKDWRGTRDDDFYQGASKKPCTVQSSVDDVPVDLDPLTVKSGCDPMNEDIDIHDPPVLIDASTALDGKANRLIVTSSPSVNHSIVFLSAEDSTSTPLL